MQYLEYLLTLVLKSLMPQPVVLLPSPGINLQLMRGTVCVLLVCRLHHILIVLSYLYTGAIIAYQLDVFSADTAMNVLSTTSTTNSFTGSGLMCCTTYSFRVSASTSAGFGPVTSGPLLRTLADLSG